jgi:hypothetical protein
MAYSLFADKTHQPSMEEMLGVLGPARLGWEQLSVFIEENYRVTQDWSFYGKNYGWAVRYRKGGKALASLYAGDCSFTVLMILDPDQIDRTRGLPLGPQVSKVIEDAHPYPEGRWLFIKVTSESDLNDVRQLLAIRATPVRQSS